TDALVALVAAVAGTRAIIEVHFSEEPRSYALAMAEASRILPRVLPIGMSVTLRCWKQRVGGERLHNRYLLTDVGGVQFGDGIEVGEAGEHDRVSILDDPSWTALWVHYASDAPAFDDGGAPCTVASSRR